MFVFSARMALRAEGFLIAVTVRLEHNLLVCENFVSGDHSGTTGT